jgi:Uma2 family endonuclease
MSTVTRLLTYEEWIDMPTVEDGIEEVVKGELRFMPPNHADHAFIIENLTAVLLPQVNRKQVSVIGSNIGQMISRKPLTCRSPDMLVFWREGMVIERGLLWSPSDLIIEVLSPYETKRRQQEKLDDYESIAAPEVWLIDSKMRSVRVHLLTSGKLVPREVTSGQLEPTRFPDVSIPVSEIWPR